MKPLLAAGLLLLAGSVSAQPRASMMSTSAMPTTEGLTAFFNAPTVVLPRLFAAAIDHSAEIQRLDVGRDIAQADVKLIRKHVLSVLAINSTYSYGTLPYFATAESTRPYYQLNPFALGARAQYSAGLGVSVPFEILASRRTAILRQDLLVDQAVAQRQVYEQTLRQEVITTYQALVLAHTLMLHYQEELQTARLSKQIADRRFQQGELELSEQLMAGDFYSKAVLAYEESRNHYQTSQLLLENLIGVPITSISTVRN